jgi:hypothetical protein
MKQQLRFNICGLKSSFLWDSEVPGLKDRIEQEVPPTLTYATHHWTDHVARSTSSELAHALLEDFLSNRLLFWIEVMNLKQGLKTGIAMLSLLKSWLPLPVSWVHISRMDADVTMLIDRRLSNRTMEAAE